MPSRGDIEAGGAYIGISIEDTGYHKSIDEIKKGLKSVGTTTDTVANQLAQSVDKVGRHTQSMGYKTVVAFKQMGLWIQSNRTKIAELGQRLSSVGKQMLVVAVLMAAPLVASLKVFTAFSKQMAFVATMLDEPTKYMSRFTKQIRIMSVQFGESTETLARGMYDILSAGFAPNQALQMLTVTSKAAKAGLATTAQATKAIVAVLNSYSLSAEHAAEVSDTLFTTVRYGVTTFEELAGHIGLVAASAAQIDVSMDELGASIAAITRGGIETSAAVIALQNILKAFQSPTGEGADFARQLKEAGLKIDISIQGIRDRGFLNIFKEIAKLPEEALSRLFPSIRAGRGAYAMKAAGEALMGIYDKFAMKLGATDEAAKKVAESFGFLAEQVKQAGLLMLNYIGEALADSLKNVGERVLFIALGFGEWIKVNKNWIASALKLTFWIGELAIALMVLGKVLAVTAAISAALTMQWWVMASAIAAAIAAALAMDAIFSKISDTTGKMSLLGEGMFGGIKEGISIIDELNMEMNNLVKERVRVVRQLKALQSEFDASQKLTWLFGTVGMDTLGKELTRYKKKADFLDKEIDYAKRQIAYNQKKLAAERELLRVKEDQAMIDAATGISRYGHLLGYWHTPVLEHAGISKSDQQLDELKMIRENTSVGGAITNAIAESTKSM